MRYKYCKECKEPIRALSSFNESVIKGIAPKKKLKPGCGESFPYCMECFLRVKNDVLCLNTHCRKMFNRKCMYKVNEIVLKENPKFRVDGK